eukprot:4134212-Pleurochrysis_carterae.AAC.1
MRTTLSCDCLARMPAILVSRGSKRSRTSKRVGVGKSKKTAAITSARMSAGSESGSSCTPSKKMFLWASKDVTVFAAFRAS